jgi:hypothetical protein
MSVDEVVQHSRNPLDTILTTKNDLPADLRASLLLLVLLSNGSSKENNIEFLLEASQSVRERASRDLSFKDDTIGKNKGKIDTLISPDAQALLSALDILSEIDQDTDIGKASLMFFLSALNIFILYLYLLVH